MCLHATETVLDCALHLLHLWTHSGHRVISNQPSAKISASVQAGDKLHGAFWMLHIRLSNCTDTEFANRVGV